ncbi:MAG: outer membrane lipoprotein carrier protein LolA [Bacteroidales bacterium]|nr:outer membrane lipoprotein carrier protein LolA [Bacteroidales bacterium]MBO7378314.1 outer membrane lipoprotein carrier protein LolA [Bacteroidales bacterium]MBP5214039.1 outer membrane lipoprotein carrier protein LolA [Bacteroidales bacterium]
MKKILTVLFGLVLAASPLSSGLTSVQAQDADIMQKAQERFKNMETLEADVVMTKHNTMVTKDVTSKGKFYFKKPSKMTMSFNEGADLLLMDGQTFTMVKDGKKQTMSGNGNSQLEALKTLLQNFSAGQESEVDLSDIADVDMERNGDLVVITVTPIVTDAKQKRKMMFTSFVVTVNTKKSELKTVRMNEKGENYTEYEFSNFKVNGNVPDAVFVAK